MDQTSHKYGAGQSPRMFSTQEKRFAVLIDADNVSAKYVKNILDEVSSYGVVTYKRIYGDWTKESAASWKKVLLENSISPVQQYSYTTGKNSTDSAMIIDAMDILYSNSVDGFCLVSSDSDFTRLAVRIRESGMMVIGMGESKTPKAFSAACNIFKYLDILLDQELKEGNSLVTTEARAGAKSQSMTDLKTIEESLFKIISEHGNDDEWIDVAALANYLGKRYPDFDVRNYGYTKFSLFLSEFDSLEKERGKDTIMVRIKQSELRNRVENTVLRIIHEYGEKGVYMKKLYIRLLEEYPDFNIREYGYTSITQFFKSIEGIRVRNSYKNGSVKSVVYFEEVVEEEKEEVPAEASVEAASTEKLENSENLAEAENENAPVTVV